MQTVGLLRSNCISLPLEAKISPAASPAEGQETKRREPPEMRDHRRAPGGNFARCAISGSPLVHDKGRVLDSGRMCEHSSASKPTRGGMKPKKNQSQAEEFHVSSAAPRGKRAEKCRYSV